MYLALPFQYREISVLTCVLIRPDGVTLDSNCHTYDIHRTCAIQGSLCVCVCVCARVCVWVCAWVWSVCVHACVSGHLPDHYQRFLFSH